MANKLSLNVAKTEFMLIGSPQMIRNASNSQPNILIENKQIQQVNKSRTLGTTIDQHLSSKSNTENICKKITSGISALRRVKSFIAERDTLISIYNAIVRPYFDYCSEVWDVFGEIQSKRLQKLQNRAARTISNMSNDVDHSIALCALGWKPLDIMRKKAIISIYLSCESDSSASRLACIQRFLHSEGIRARLPSSSWQLGGLEQMQFITSPGKNGIAGVSGGKLIHFAPLWPI